MISITALILTLIASIIGTFGSLLLKKGSDKINLNKIKTVIYNYQIISGVLLYIIASIIFITALKYGKLSVLYPLLAINYVWISLVSVKYLNEKMNVLKWLGILAIIVGIFFITF